MRRSPVTPAQGLERCSSQEPGTPPASVLRGKERIFPWSLQRELALLTP